jgi:transposase-like protein
LKERGVAQERRQYSREFKLMALSRLEEAGNVEALAQELGVRREMLYVWRRQFQAGGVEALRNAGRPRPVEGVAASDQLAVASAERRIAELERKVGQQSLEIDFLGGVLQRIEASRRPHDGPGGTASSPRSRR